MESTYAHLQREMEALKRSVRQDYPDAVSDALADAFAGAGGDQMNAFLIHNQQAYGIAHPRIAKKNRQKLPAGSKSSKLSKEITINKLLDDPDMTDREAMTEIRKAFGSAKSVQLSWKTTSAAYNRDNNSFGITLIVHAVIVDHAIDDATTIPYLAKLAAPNVKTMATKVVTNKLVAYVSFSLKLTNLECGLSSTYMQPSAITVQRLIGPAAVETVRSDVNIEFLGRAMQYRAKNFPGYDEGSVKQINADGLVGF